MNCILYTASDVRMPFLLSIIGQFEAMGKLVLLLLFMTGGYFSIRYFLLKHGLKELQHELSEIRQDISCNQILHLPFPDQNLEKLMKSMNSVLEDVRRERLAYEKREQEFQKQIENISHDLRTPLTVILGYLKWLKGFSAITETAPVSTGEAKTTPATALPGRTTLADTLSIIEKNARAMERLVSQFYAFSQLNAQDYALDISPVDIGRILRESLTENYRILEQAGLELDCLLPDHPVVVRGNADALERLFSNLLQNAGRYAKSYLRIRILETDCRQVSVLFQNDSEKIQADDIPNLFNRFYKNDISRSQGGSGLGLTIARSLAEKMGGSLTASVPEEPLPEICFSLLLPRENNNGIS